MSKRREFLKSAGAVGTVGLLAGCLGGDEGDGTTDGESSPSESGGSGGTTDESTSAMTEEQTEGGEMYIDGTLNFIMSPSEPQEQMMNQYAPVRDYLSEEIGVETELRYGNNYSAVMSALGSGTADVAEMGPFAAALGVRAENVNIVLQRKGYGSYTYVSTLTTTADSDIESTEDLSGKTIAFADRLSASGALFPLFMLSQAGVEIGELPQSDVGADFTAQFAGGHDQALAAVENGQADVAGVGQFITLNDNRELSEGLKYVETYEGIPRAPICVSPELPQDQQDAVTQALLDAPESMYQGADGEADTDDDLWFSAVREASQETYQPVIDVANDLGIDIGFLEG
ncbi:phosphate/phosphite/phosphonate ABC transporter substrate-binding protein [Halomarina oriensis]|uniref:Phosphate/phosphite/phosphonate ABC transporter substrate-binding protein n=1 Tax=Halomarina oriensis TaxID=671145 RepID=A0A6B0GPS9_9EURY|nr:phosphate/phosphite/phosphonate ABC transporter substrate-binding protein [Halomarina oriensis]MWG34663.1 phosphate/phosphite/phosphonate ABC transporter substrate-binding protein [Halomarina oriensis]